MMLEEFYQNVYLDVFYRYIVLNQKRYLEDHIICKVQEEDDIHKVIVFELPDIYGRVTIWSNAIIEEEIFKKEDNDLLFYLHYKMVNILQGQNLFHEFYNSLTSQSIFPPHKILLCCSGGLTTSFFAQKMQELIALEKLNVEVFALGFHQLQKYYRNYDAIYLAPQIAYLEPQAIHITNREIPIYSITPSVYATQNYKELLDIIIENSKKAHLKGEVN